MKYILLIFIIIAILIAIYCLTHKVKIKLKTFFKRGFKPSRGNFGIYCYDGKQGKGKTYSLVEYLQDNKDSSLIFCNIKNIRHIDYTFYTGFNQLMEIKQYIDSPEFHTD